jgi:hypothetical protein
MSNKFGRREVEREVVREVDREVVREVDRFNLPRRFRKLLHRDEHDRFNLHRRLHELRHNFFR